MQLGDLQVDVNYGATVRVDFRGKSNHREPNAILHGLFADIFKNAAGPHRSVELHFERLEFFNSSTISLVVQFVKELVQRKIVTRVTYNPNHKWQKVFFDAMGMLKRADGVLKITPAVT